MFKEIHITTLYFTLYFYISPLYITTKHNFILFIQVILFLLLGVFLCKTYFVLPRKALKWFPLSIVAKLMTAMIRTDSAA